MHLDLTTEEVQSLINVLGDLPTKSNAFPLLVKISTQAKGQLEAVPAPAEKPAGKSTKAA